MQDRVSALKVPISESLQETVKQAAKEEELKLLTRDEHKEFQVLRELLNGLSTFQIRFIEQYIRTASAGLAARKAGSRSNTPETIGYKLLQNPNIQKAIAIAMKKRIEAVGLDTIEVIMKIREVYDAALEAGKYDAANKACELLQKEIERASRAPGYQAEVSRPGAVFARLPSEEYLDNTKEDLEKVIEIISRRKDSAETTNNTNKSLTENISKSILSNNVVAT